MSSKFRGVKWNNASFPGKIRIRRSIDLAELGDFGSIDSDAIDLPTSGAVHRDDTKGSKSGTRQYVDLRTIQGKYSNVVDTQDMGLIGDATTTHRVWSPSGAITDVVTTAPTGILAPSNTGDTGSGDTDTGSGDTDTGSGTGPVSLAYTLENPNPYDISTDDRFGWTIAIDGDRAIVGSRQEDDADGSANSGKAYIFDTSTGALLHTLDNPNAWGPSENDYFGNSVGIDGGYAIVGAYSEYFTSGKAYIFDTSTGALLHTLDNPNPYGTKYDWFGYRVAISGNRAIVGAYGEGDADGHSSGKAYIFDVTTGTLLHTLVNPNPYGTSQQDYFTSRLAISSNYAIVAAWMEDDAGGDDSGKAYIYNASTGTLLHTLDNPNPYGTSVDDYFGYSVAIDDNYAIVGTGREDDTGVYSSGKAYIYNASTGALLHTLDNPNVDGNSNNDNFGSSVAISGDRVIVGAYGEGSSAGKVYIFDVTTGTLVQTIDNPIEGQNNWFGFNVGISGDNVIVGTYENSSNPGSGAVYIFQEASATPAIEMDPSSPDFDHTNFSWTITTSYDVPNPPVGLNMTAYENGEYAQVPETDAYNSGTWTITTDAPDGTVVYMYTSNTYLGTYDSQDDPENSDFSGSVYGTKTVQNGQITGNFSAYNDGITEDGELKKIVIKDKNTWTYGEYTKLAETQWLHFVDESNAWSPPQSGDSVLGGEAFAIESGIYWTQWQTAADSATGNPQIILRVSEDTMTNDRQTITYLLDNIYGPGSSFFIVGHGMTTLTSTPNKSYASQTLAVYTFDLDTAPSSTQYLTAMRFYA